jgi:hypothetical protein
VTRVRASRLAAGGVVLLFLVTSVVAFAIAPPGQQGAAGHAPSPHPVADFVGFTSVQLLYLALSVVLLLRRPDNSISWLLGGLVTLMSLGVLSDALVKVRGDSWSWWSTFGAWYGSWWFAAMMACFLLLFHLFPTGRPVQGPWRAGSYVAMAAAALSLSLMFGVADDAPEGSFVIDVPAWLHSVQVVAVAGSWIAALLLVVPVLVVRYRRSASTERQQIKWFIFSVAASLFVWFLMNPWVLMFYVAAALPGIGVGIALLRYRLYDIDRVISRTTSYALVTGLVLGTYVAVVALVTRLLPQSDALAVAAATLAAAAIARPVLRRVQDVVDRRFDRARYDAQVTVDEFARGLRTRVDPELVVDQLLGVVHQAIHPAHVSVWTSGSSR